MFGAANLAVVPYGSLSMVAYKFSDFCLEFMGRFLQQEGFMNEKGLLIYTFLVVGIL